ncbi:YozE family protein [Bacillus carboniphilus]|uniref:UPF0346 protein LC087_03820 n=1 Tax=Bacillus carboniphilus TaxID=86663 RepID=A0ABY9JV91_9BACI|nr:YozE family protein [Bacillus carboniphilus]WLR43326.1 YozE family protein [Bacillus carboniphilus]
MKSFYHFLMKFRHEGASDEISNFANNVYRDHSFPKSSTHYDELSRYLELNGDYLPNMTIFDSVWEKYLIEK